MDNQILNEFQRIAGWTDEDMKQITIIGQDPVVRTRLKIGEAIAAAHAACGLAAAKLWELRTGHKQQVVVDVTEAVASLNSYMFLNIDIPKTTEKTAAPESSGGQAALSLSEVLKITGSYKTKDGRWFYVHASTDSTPILEVLQCECSHEALSSAIAGREAAELEEAFIRHGANGGICRSAEEWMNTEQGKLLSALPILEIKKVADTEPIPFFKGTRPLSGIRTLDLTRVLSGPTTTRTLAEHGSDVLWVGAPHLSDVPYFALDTGHGKRAAFLDIRKEDEKKRLYGLISKADVFCQSYRLGSQMSREFSWENITSKNPGIIYSHITAFGQEGPWANNPGWEQVGQAVTGIQLEESSMPIAPINEYLATLPCGPLYSNLHENAELGRPRILPCAFSDYMSGYVNAFGVMVALYRRAVEGGTFVVSTSLAQSSMALHNLGLINYDVAYQCPSDSVPSEVVKKLSIEEYGKFGHMTYLKPVVHMTETPPYFDKPTVIRGSSEPVWLA